MSTMPSRIDSPSEPLPFIAAEPEQRPAAIPERSGLREIFRVRAEQFARKTSAEGERVPTLSLIVLRIGEECFAFHLSQAVQVLSQLKVTPVYGGPGCLKGVANFRGRVLSVIDLRYLMKMIPSEAMEGYILVVRNGQSEIGIWADAVEGVRAYPADAVKPLSTESLLSSNGMVQNVMSDRVSLLDCEALMAHVRTQARLEKTGEPQDMF